MKKIMMLLITSSIFFSCKSQTKEEAKDTKIVQTEETVQVKNPIHLLDVAAFKKGITNSGIQLIDVRTPKEYKGGYIENATLIDYYSSHFKDSLLTLDTAKPIYVYCKSGGRSGKTSKILAELGFKEIYDLKGGYRAWEKQ